MEERRFNEVEVGAILGRAANAEGIDRAQPAGRGGLTLAQLQEIGREVGIPPELIRESSEVVGRVGIATTRRFIGLPLGVGRTIELGRRLTDDEWERLVVDLRETFDARGTVGGRGALRQWTNGNLQALLEPTSKGDRVRLRTTRMESRAYMMAGLTVVGVSAATLVAAALAGIAGAPDTLSSLCTIAFVGAAMFGLGAFRLPSWARRRREQMEEVAERLALVASSDR